MKPTLYIIDVYSLLFQVFHAIPPMTAPDGRPTNAVYGLTRDLMNILEQKQPTHLVCALDVAGDQERNEIFGDYKANRAEMPEDLRPQIPLVIDVIEGMNLPAIGHAGWEADDVIATLTRQAVDDGMEVVIVSTDKDARQLLGPGVRMFNCRKNEFFDVESLQKTWGIRPDQVVDFQSLVGDSVDNVPGVPLIGPKKAQALLEKWDDLDTVLQHADEAPGKKLRENLVSFADQARMSRELVRLRTDLPLEFDLQQARVHEPDAERLAELFGQLGFRRFREDMQARLNQAKPQAAASQRRPVNVTTTDELATFIAQLRQQPAVAVQPELGAAAAQAASVTGLAIVWEGSHAFYVPLESVAFRDEVLEALSEAFAAEGGPALISHDIKRTLRLLNQSAGSTAFLATPGVDPMLADYLLDAGGRSHDLAALSQRYLNRELEPAGDNSPKQKTMFETDAATAAQSVRRHAETTWDVAAVTEQRLREDQLWDLYDSLERPLICVLHAMETRGIRVDTDELQRQSRELTGALDALTAEIYDMAGHEFNIDSPKQLRTVLFEELGLPVVKRTKTGPSTNFEVLEKLASEHALPARIIEHRHLSKLKNTYLDALPRLVNPETGRIHATFQQAVAATGRLSSTDPNLQNIPIRTPEGRKVRRAFIPGEAGWKLVCADYSQIELRVLAHFCGDPELAAAFRDGIDIHTAVAADIFDVAKEDVSSEMRRVAKAVNFGVIYGQSPYGLSAAIGISREEAEGFIDEYFAKYARVDDFLHQVLEETARTGYARTILNRRRSISGIRNTTGRQRNMPERTAINTVIQGSAADLIKQAMINVHNRMKRESHPGHMLLQIHDELVFEVPAEHAESLVELVSDEMENAFDLSVPLVVDASIADNWLDAK